MSDRIETQNASQAKRRIRLREPLDAAQAEQCKARLLAVPGVVALEMIKDGAALVVVYDLAQLDFAGLKKTLNDAGAPPADGRWQRLRGALYQFMDENMRANLQSRAACCSKPPPGYRSRR